MFSYRFIATANFSLRFHLASTRKRLKTITFENGLQRQRYENDTKTMCRMQYNHCVFIENEYVFISFSSKPQTFLCVFTLYLHEYD